MLIALHCTRCTRSTTSLARTVLPHESPGNGRSLTHILDARTASSRCRSASVYRRIILAIIIKQVSFGLPDKKFGPAADEETRAPRKILTITESYSLPEVKYHNNQYLTILYTLKHHNNQYFTILYILKYHNNQYFTILYILKHHNNQYFTILCILKHHNNHYFTILYVLKYHNNQYFTLPPQGRCASKEHCRTILRFGGQD